MYKKKAKLIFKHNSFDIIEEGDFVLCAISKKKFYLKILIIGASIFKRPIILLKK